MANRRQMDALPEEKLCFNPVLRDPLSSAKLCIRYTGIFLTEVLIQLILLIPIPALHLIVTFQRCDIFKAFSTHSFLKKSECFAYCLPELFSSSWADVTYKVSLNFPLSYSQVRFS